MENKRFYQNIGEPGTLFCLILNAFIKIQISLVAHYIMPEGQRIRKLESQFILILRNITVHG